LRRELQACGLESVPAGRQVLLSVNRFERKKGLHLALQAFAQVHRRQPDRLHLVMAGMSQTYSFSAQLKFSGSIQNFTVP
jgi:glycosyltransferase involved in cell wall biosynthesis